MKSFDIRSGSARHLRLCAAVRAGALLGVAMSLALPAIFWTDAARLADLAPQIAGLPCGAAAVIDETAQAWAVAISVVPIALAIGFFVTVWRLFGEFRAGRALTLPAQRLLQQLAWLLLAIVVSQPLVRAAMSVALTMANPPGQRHLVIGLGSNDYLGLIVALTLLAIFETSLRRDLRQTFNFTAFSDRETWAGGSAALNLWFGEKRNRQRRRTRLRFAGAGSWLNESGLDPRGGVRLTESVGLYHDTRKYGLAPERGFIVGGSVTASQVIRVDPGQEDHRYSLDFDVGWAQSFPLAHHHVLATRLDASIVVPLASEPEFRSLNRAGGAGGLAGFTGNELFARGMLIAALEYRHTIFDDLRIPLANLLWLRSIGGVAFGGVASLSSCDSLNGWLGRDSWYGYYGYGLTANMQIFGVTPQFFRIDVSAPIGRRPGECLGELLPNYIVRRASERRGEDYDPDAKVRLPPVNINISFNQPF